MTSGSVFWSTYVLLVRGPSSQADKSRGLSWQPSPIRHWAVVFPLCPYFADKRTYSGVCQPNVLVVTSQLFSFAIQRGWNYSWFCLGPWVMVKHTPQWAVDMQTPAGGALGTLNESPRVRADCFQLLLPPSYLSLVQHRCCWCFVPTIPTDWLTDKTWQLFIQMKCWTTFLCSNNCSMLRNLQSETCCGLTSASVLATLSTPPTPTSPSFFVCVCVCVSPA